MCVGITMMDKQASTLQTILRYFLRYEKSNEGKHHDDDNDYYLDYHYRVDTFAQNLRFQCIHEIRSQIIHDDDKEISLLVTLWRSFNVMSVIFIYHYYRACCFSCSVFL